MGGWVSVYVLAQVLSPAPHKLAVVHACNSSIPEEETAGS